MKIIKPTILLALLSSSSIAMAQAVPQSPAPSKPPVAEPAPTATPQDQGLQDIVVTAQRRSENLQKAAISVTAAGTDDLKRAAVTEVSGLTTLAPALQASRQGAFTIFYIRGVGGPSVNAYSESPVAYNLDGIYVSRANSVNGQFFDIERIEVLKGPQGTLYGRNATAGAINVITQKPKLDKVEGYLNLEYGNFEKKQAEGAKPETGCWMLMALGRSRNRAQVFLSPLPQLLLSSATAGGRGAGGEGSGAGTTPARCVAMGLSDRIDPIDGIDLIVDKSTDWVAVLDAVAVFLDFGFLLSK